MENIFCQEKLLEKCKFVGPLNVVGPRTSARYALHRWRNRGDQGGPGPPTFFSGGAPRGALIYSFISTMLPLHECI